MPDANGIPTTNEMDSTTDEDRYKLVAQCNDCDEWKHFTGDPMKTTQTTGLVCDNCGGTRFSNLISERTFNPNTAKRKRTSRR